MAALRLLAALGLSLPTVFLRLPVRQPVLWSIPPHHRHVLRDAMPLRTCHSTFARRTPQAHREGRHLRSVDARCAHLAASVVGVTIR